MEFDNLIPGKFCFWREIFAILKEIVLFRWIFWYFSYNSVLKICKKFIFLITFLTVFQGNFAFFPALGFNVSLKIQAFPTIKADPRIDFLLFNKSQILPG